MMKYILVIMVLFVSLLEAESKPGLFGKVVHIENNDVLNIRQKPDYKSKKVGSLPNGAYMGIEKCQKTENSLWCKVYEVSQNFSEEYNPGWVNAIYLSFSNNGYVVINNRPSACFYSLKCTEDKCLVVLDMSYDYEKDKMNDMKTEWIKKEILRGESHFGAMNTEEDGFCNNANIIEKYKNSYL